MSNNKQENLFEALGLFIRAMRLFIRSEVEKHYKKHWEEIYFDSLSDRQQKEWDYIKQSVIGPAKLIDFGTLGSFALRRKDFFEPFFGRAVNKLPTMFYDIAEARNMNAHYNKWDSDLVEIAYLNMIRIAKSLGMSELELELRRLKSADTEVINSIPNPMPVSRKAKKNNKLKKSEAIQFVNNAIGSNVLNNLNCNFANIASNKSVWWININIDRLNRELNLLLAKSDGGFLWLKIPNGSLTSPEKYFKIRTDNNKNDVDLEISAEPGFYYLRDVKSGGTGFDFKKYVEKEF